MYRVKTDKNDKIDNQNGTLKDTNLTKTNVKLDKEALLSLGVALFMKNDGTEEGQQCFSFDFTKHVIIPEAD